MNIHFRTYWSNSILRPNFPVRGGPRLKNITAVVGAISLLRDAVANQDQLLYDEPADWYYPVRESLGGMMLQTGDAKGAEQVFREDLQQNPRNPRSLFGLAEALTLQNRNHDASWVKQQFGTAWQGADVSLKVEDL